MLVHPWNAAIDEEEWRSWIADGHDFGQLVAVAPDRSPIIVPTHFFLDGDRVLLHLARPNPICRALENDPRCVLTVTGDYAFIPGPLRVTGDTPASQGVPTSYHTSVQIRGVAEIIDDPDAKVSLLRDQMAHFQPEGGSAPLTTDDPPFGQMLSGLRGVVLSIESVTAVFKYDDQKPVEMQYSVAEHLSSHGNDGAAAQQLRRARRRSTDS
jgi:transcriptional regulator